MRRADPEEEDLRAFGATVLRMVAPRAPEIAFPALQGLLECLPHHHYLRDSITKTLGEITPQI